MHIPIYTIFKKIYLYIMFYNLIKNIKILMHPVEQYKIYYIKSLLDKIDYHFDNDKVLSIKILKNQENISIKLQFINNSFIVKYSTTGFYFKDKNSEILENNLKFIDNLNLNDFKNKIMNQQQVIDFMDLFKKDFYNDSNYLKLFLIQEHDYKRNNLLDKFYAKNYKHILLKECKGKCFFCDSNKNLQLDHFFVPKSKGGNFILKTYDGFYINNGMILCDICNMKKNDGTFKKFDNFIDYENLNKIQYKMNKILNHLKY